MVVCHVCNASHRGVRKAPEHPRFVSEIAERLAYGDRAVMGKPVRAGPSTSRGFLLVRDGVTRLEVSASAILRGSRRLPVTVMLLVRTASERTHWRNSA